MKKIDFIDLKAQYKAYKNEMDKALESVCEKASFIMGEDVGVLEKRLSEFTGSKHAITCSSGTDALLLSLMALDIKPGDEIITTPFSFIATAEVIAFLGAKPVFIDIEDKTYNIDPSKIEEKITEKTRAIMPVALYGQPADMDEINSIADKHSLAVIEDACQSFGAEYKGKKSCNLSTIGCTSFFPSKPLGCYGDGGAVFTNDDEIAAKIKSLRVHGQTKRYHHKYIGMNGRLDTIQAAVLNIKLDHFEPELKKRAAIASKYSEKLKNIQGIILPFVKDDRTSVFAQYSIRVKNREETIRKLNEAGIPTAVHYPVPMHIQEACLYLGYKEGDFPISEAVSREIMSIPMGPFLKEDDLEYIVSGIKSNI